MDSTFRCGGGGPWHAVALITIFVTMFVWPILLIAGAVREYRRADLSGAAEMLAGVMALIVFISAIRLLDNVQRGLLLLARTLGCWSVSTPLSSLRSDRSSAHAGASRCSMPSTSAQSSGSRGVRSLVGERGEPSPSRRPVVARGRRWPLRWSNALRPETQPRLCAAPRSHEVSGLSGRQL